MLKQEAGHEFEASLSYRVRLYLKKKEKRKERKETKTGRKTGRKKEKKRRRGKVATQLPGSRSRTGTRSRPHPLEHSKLMPAWATRLSGQNHNDSVRLVELVAEVTGAKETSLENGPCIQRPPQGEEGRKY